MFRDGFIASHRSRNFLKMTKLVTRCWLIALFATLLAAPAGADIGMSAPPYSQNFNSLTNTGAASWLDDVNLSGWYILCRSFEPCTVSGYTASTGSSSGVSVYSFGSSGSSDRALGNVASSGPLNSTRFTYELLFTNGPSFIQSNITVSYVGEQWRKSGTTSPHKLQFYYRVFPGGKGGSIAVTNLSFTSPVNTSGAAALNGNSSANRHVFSNIPLSGAIVKPGESLFLMWVEAEDSGAGHGLAIDDVSVNWSSYDLTIHCPPDLVLTNLADVPPPDVNSVSVGYDCGNPIVTHIGDTSVTNLCATTIYRTYQVTDDCNRTDSCTQVITIDYPPLNDNFTNAIEVNGTATVISGCNFGATKEPGEPSHAYNPGGASVWWRWVAPASGSVTINGSSDSFEALIAVWTGSVVSNLTFVANNYASGGGTVWYNPTFTFNAVKGTTYYIAVDGALDWVYCCPPPNFVCSVCGFSGSPPQGTINMSLCVTPRIERTNSYSILEPGGIRVYYEAVVNDESANCTWEFFDSDGAPIPSLAATGLIVDHLFGPFEQFPASFQLNVSNGCDGTGTSGSFPQCGAICLTLGSVATRAGTDGSGLNSYSLSNACAMFTSANSRWFSITRLTNAAAVAYVSAEGSAGDTKIGVFRGGIVLSNLFPLACDTNANGHTAYVEFETRPKSNYWLAVITTNPSALRLTYGYSTRLSGASMVLSNGAVELRSDPLPSLRFRLEAATNLDANAVWFPLVTNNYSGNASASSNIVRYMDAGAVSHRQRFYRLVWLP